MNLCLHPDFTTWMYDCKEGTLRILSIGSRNTAIASRGAGRFYPLPPSQIPPALRPYWRSIPPKTRQVACYAKTASRQVLLISSPFKLDFTAHMMLISINRVSTRSTDISSGIKWEEREADIVFPQNLLNYCAPVSLQILVSASQLFSDECSTGTYMAGWSY